MITTLFWEIRLSGRDRPFTNMTKQMRKAQHQVTTQNPPKCFQNASLQFRAVVACCVTNTYRMPPLCCKHTSLFFLLLQNAPCDHMYSVRARLAQFHSTRLLEGVSVVPFLFRDPLTEPTYPSPSPDDQSPANGRVHKRGDTEIMVQEGG